MRVRIKEIIKKKQFIILAIIVCTIMVISLTSLTVNIIKQEQIKRMQETPLLTYEIKSENDDEEIFNILIKITSVDGIETIKYKDSNNDKEITLFCKGKNRVGIDYKVVEFKSYDFKIKQKGKEEVTETIYFEVPYIEGEYALVNGVYSNVPDLTGYDEKFTRYLVVEDGSLQVGDWISTEKPSNWYNYNESQWANIYVENNGLDTYYTWIPRYCFKLDQENQRSDVKFIDVFNNYKDENGNVTTWQELKRQGYQVPAAFKWNMTKIPGYWAMKYTAGDVITPSVIYYNMSVNRGVIQLTDITLNTSITNSNPIVKYTCAINGQIVQTIESSEQISNIGKQVISFTNMQEGENTVNITGLNSKGEIVGSMTKVYKPAVVNAPELKQFNQDTTFYVTYDENGNEHSTIPISEQEPEDWYEYGEARWANIVTRNNGLETYYVWIPRYEFILDQTNQRSTVQFIEGTSTDTSQEGYQIPEAFTFNGVELTGYWAMKYTAGEEYAAMFNTELTSTKDTIKTSGITGTAVGDGQIYRYYINGEYKYETTNRNETYEFTGLTGGETYTILVEIRNSTTDAYIGSIVKQIKIVEANKPELLGFNESMTYYVTYDESGNEIIGNNIKNDGSNMPENWYDYSDSRWANIVVTNGTVENGKITGATLTTYYVWIPRYQFRLDQTNQRSIVSFIEGTSIEVETGYQIPEAFTFNGKELTGYWAMKYTAGE